MFIQRFTLSPAFGKGRELRALVEERVKKAQGQGRANSLATSVFGDIPSLVITLRFNDLAEFEKLRAKNAADKDWQEYVGKLSSMATIKSELLEVIVPFPKS
jgi:NIPSNAP